MNRRTLILWGTLLLVLVAANAIIYGRERLRAEGTVVYLELAPVDPRSLIQGDYMELRYRIAQDIENAHGPERGRVVIRVDERDIAHFVRLYDGHLGDDERLLRYEIRPTGVQIGAESFFFEEGHGDDYEDARYAELRVSEDGDVTLVALRDADFSKLGSE
jgi:uncharacterized membrane-anchored protein